MALHANHCRCADCIDRENRVTEPAALAADAATWKPAEGVTLDGGILFGPKVLMLWAKGPCARRVVTCVIEALDGSRIVGRNDCRNPQQSCPREPGEGYEKCKTVCDQMGHAEEVAADLAGERVNGATATVYGHTYACKPCQERLFGAGLRFLSIHQGDDF